MSDRKPNVLFILSDQHRYCSMPGVDGCEVIAPAFERLAAEGVTFTNSYSCYPLCSPARAMMVSGRWPTDTGVTFNDYELYTTPTSLGTVFQDAGYHTAYVGKWHLHEGPKENVDHNDHYIPPGPGRHGFSYLKLWNETNKHWQSYWYDDPDGERVPYKGYNATGMTDQAVDFIQNDWNREQPFFLCLSVNPPHGPMHDAPPEFFGLYDPDTIRLRPNVPDEFAANEKSHNVGGGFPASAPLRTQLAHYYGHVSAIDNEVNRLLDLLDENGISDETCVVYGSDHGDMLGSHGLMRKSFMYSENNQVPLLIRYPGKIPEDTIADGMFSTIDVYPTLLGLAGIPAPEGTRGMDLSHLAFDENGPEQDHILHFYCPSDDRTMRRGVWGVRTKDFLFFEEKETIHLYDRRVDPYEMNNVAGTADYADVEADLMKKLGAGRKLLIESRPD